MPYPIPAGIYNSNANARYAEDEVFMEWNKITESEVHQARERDLFNVIAAQHELGRAGLPETKGRPSARRWSAYAESWSEAGNVR